jgi:hypothetical protein
MKKMLLAAAALTVMASPALAQSRSAYGQAAWQAAPFSRGAPFGTYARTPGYAFQAYGAYSYGRYIGTDPDPSVRLMLLTDAGSENN